MTFTLESVVPWGRTFDEYVSMFALSTEELKLDILGVSDGPASFNAEATAQGVNVLSIDPLYSYSASQIQEQFLKTKSKIIEQIESNQSEFSWSTFSSIDKHVQAREQAMEMFIEDFSSEHSKPRYLSSSLPLLPLEDQKFDLSLCSHFLFLYSLQHNRNFHMKSITEMCRVSKQVRIFPVLELGAKESRHLSVVRAELESEGYDTELKQVSYEVQKGGNQMLCVQHA